MHQLPETTGVRDLYVYSITNDPWLNGNVQVKMLGIGHETNQSRASCTEGD